MTYRVYVVDKYYNVVLYNSLADLEFCKGVRRGRAPSLSSPVFFLPFPGLLSSSPPYISLFCFLPFLIPSRCQAICQLQLESLRSTVNSPAGSGVDPRSQWHFCDIWDKKTCPVAINSPNQLGGISRGQEGGAMAHISSSIDPPVIIPFSRDVS